MVSEAFACHCPLYCVSCNTFCLLLLLLFQKSLVKKMQAQVQRRRKREGK